jgi:hypothetical protein
MISSFSFANTNEIEETKKITKEQITICREISRNETTNPMNGVTTVTITYRCVDYPYLSNAVIYID